MGFRFHSGFCRYAELGLLFHPGIIAFRLVIGKIGKFSDRRIQSQLLSESQRTRRTRKTRKGVLGILVYFHNHQVFCKSRTRRLLISHLYRREFYTLESSSDKTLHTLKYLLSIWRYQTVAHSS